MLVTLRNNIEELELKIQEIRYKLELREDEGVWGRASSLTFRPTGMMVGGVSFRDRGRTESMGSEGGSSAGRRSSAPPEFRSESAVDASMVNYSDNYEDEDEDEEEEGEDAPFVPPTPGRPEVEEALLRRNEKLGDTMEAMDQRIRAITLQ